MILDCQNICKSYGTDVILDNISFHLEEKEKMAIVGINGAGKTTLLKIIMKEEEADSGQVVLSKDRTIGYLSQHQDIYYNDTVYGVMEDVMKPVIALQDKMRQLEQDMKHLEGEELEKALELYNRYTHEFEYKNGYAYESEINGVLKGLGFSKEDFDRHTDTLSGGQKTRLSLGRLLLQKPDIIILDEPTNHLDMSSITWLEGFLTNYQGSVIIVSHDRYFLDKIVTKIVELDNSHGKVYNGNYTFYAEKRAEIRANMMKAYLNQQAEIKHQEEVITKLNQFNREKSIKRAESREKMLDRVERIEKPTEIASEMKLTLEPSIISGEDVLTIENLSKSFTQYTLFENLNIEIKRGEHVALIGGNGTGKTTILKIINKLVPKDAGTVILGSRVKIGYYDQEHQVLNNSNTIFDEISDAYPDLTNTRIRNVLAAFLFTGEDVFKKIGDLSGGEKGRVSLAKLMLSSANFLILDEPTNHLDITSKEILENALRNYTGTVLYVSHDRYFINQTATRIIELKDKVITNYIGNYDYYESHCDSAVQAGRAAFAPISDTSENTEVRQESQAKLSWKENKAEQARLRKKANDLKKLEDRIEAIETRINEIDKEFLIPENATNVPLLNELTNERNTLEEELNNLYEEWEELSQ
jgi:ATP-binding cassette subfamily F protein 3